MDSDPLRDPRYETLAPTSDEVEAWVAAERKRREAWLAGPSREEKEDWSRRYRRRAALGLAESRLPPSPEEIESWAEREHKRRQAWMAGPTEAEKQEWARRYGRRDRAVAAEPRTPPTAEEVEAWAKAERERRQEWLAGPTDQEKERWIRGEMGGPWADLLDLPAQLLNLPMMDDEIFDTAHRFLREVDLVGKGTLYALSRAPMALWSYFAHAGRRFEEEFYRQPTRRRVRF